MSVRSYTGGDWRRQSASVALCCLALSLAGCAGMGLPFGEAQSQAALSTSIKPAAAVVTRANDAVNPSDWETVRRVLAAIPADAKGGSDLAWHNADTGSDGTVTPGEAVKKSASLCRTFAATVNDPRGIRGYRGEACRAPDGRWTLSGIAPDDSTLL
jgi:surface antigen